MKVNKLQQMIKEVSIINEQKVKPNYASIGRKYDIDPRTVKKYYDMFSTTDKEGTALKNPINRTRKKPSILDNYVEEIITKLNISRTTKRGVYEFLVNKYDLSNVGSYSNFKYYCKKNELRKKENNSSYGPKYETEAGEMAQVDWKESIVLHYKNGEVIEFNIFHIVLKFSRYSYLEYSVTKERTDVIRCLINGLQYFNGVPDIILFDNMRTVCDISNKEKKVNNKIVQLGKDFGFNPKLCKARRPNTKGTNETRNKILDWIRAYDYEFENENELIIKIKEINDLMNMNICQGTNVQPVLIYSTKEKKYLNQLPNNNIIESYFSLPKTRVENDGLIRVNGNKYSVDKPYINKYVYYDIIDNRIYIYYKSKLIEIHNISDKPINYKIHHYQELLRGNIKESDIEKKALENLDIFDKLLENRSTNVNKTSFIINLTSLAAYISNYNDDSLNRDYISLKEHKKIKLLNLLSEIDADKESAKTLIYSFIRKCKENNDE